jgi:hypothetical protein
LAYAVATAGLLGLTRGLARELSDEGVTVNAVAPGYIESPFHEGEPAGAAEKAAEQIPAGRVGTPQDVAAAVRYLVSPEAGYVHGQVLHVNDGWWFGTCAPTSHSAQSIRLSWRSCSTSSGWRPDRTESGPVDDAAEYHCAFWAPFRSLNDRPAEGSIDVGQP